MILRHFKLREQPFGMTPDPRYLYAGSTHREALASLLYGIESGAGFVMLTAMPGMGKTTLLFECLRRLREKTRTVFLFQTITNPVELLRAILIDLEVENVGGSAVELQAKLNDVLKNESAHGKRLVLVIDEAQNLDEPVLEAVRMLSNFETAREKLIQIILCGQLQLAEKLASPQLLQLRQRIAIFAHLRPLTLADTTSYIQHRLKVAGFEGDESIFTPAAMAAIAKESKGVPRNINNLCFNALSLGYALSSKSIDVDIIQEVVSDLDLTRYFETRKTSDDLIKAVPHSIFADQPNQPRPRFGFLGIAATIGVIFLALGGVAAYKLRAQISYKSVADETRFIPAATRNPSAPLTTAPATPTLKRVKVRDGESLYAICANAFGDCSPTTLKRILDTNPSIRDPNLIQSGQEISLPNIDFYNQPGIVEPAKGSSTQKEMSLR